MESDKKTTFTMALVVAVLLIVHAAANSCMDYCIPICQQADGTLDQNCKEAWEEYCKQVDGIAPETESSLSGVGNGM